MKRNLTEQPFFRLMGRLGDLVLLNLLWLIFCLPVLTAGAATVGMFAVAGKLAAGEDYAVGSDFLRAFRRDFGQATAVWIVLLAAGLAAAGGLRFGGVQDTVLCGLVAAASFLLGLGACCCGCWALALLARFTYPHGVLALADGGRMTAANPLPTAGILALLCWMPLLWKLVPGWFLYLLLPIALVGGSGSAVGMAALMRPAVARLERAGRSTGDLDSEPPV